MIATGQELGAKLCELFEIDPNEVRKITVVAEAGQAATVIVERFVKTDEAIETVLSEYRLVPVPNGDTGRISGEVYGR
jgi:hypothetical protein